MIAFQSPITNQKSSMKKESSDESFNMANAYGFFVGFCGLHER
ncbi:hypothetical protein RMSM_05476 [Rhodopirellula maiorica SM1]|uniref:Uncharacterized protein n=1 Tax=Rhodopirellula maiorica SM1 TaxID=1265738 RepID=M5RDP3_9BACT|nr:hypothetical protein RMSM_05476 [Rhodopirellula maiorica SM1]